MNRRHTIRKNSFLLLELLIALTLVTLTLFPLLQAVTQLKIFEKKNALSQEYPRAFRSALCEVKQKIFEGTLPLKTGLEEKNYRIVSIEEHPKKKCSLVTVEISIEKQRRTYLLYVEHG